MALDALRSHKLRSYLTLVGIVLAVTTLVAVMSVVNGLNLYVADRIANLGANAFVVDRMGIITNLRAFAAAQRRPALTAEDYRALAGGQLELSSNVGAVENSTTDVRAGDALQQDVNLMGASPNYGEIRQLNVATGRFITEADELHRQSVCFLGSQVADKLFPNVDALGKSVRAGNQTYTVIGVAVPVGALLGVSQDNFMLIPFTSYQAGWHAPNQTITIFVQARSPELMESAQDEVRVILRTRHHLAYDAPDDFAGALDGVAFFDVAVVAEDHDADIVALEVERHAFDAARKLDHFASLHFVKAVDAGDAVADRKNLADLADLGLGAEVFDLLFQDCGNFSCLNIHGFFRPLSSPATDGRAWL